MTTAATLPSAPLVDCHAHIWEPGTPFAPNAWKRPDYAYTAENFLADLDGHGIQYGVIAAASLFGTHNGHAIRAVKSHKRLRATAIVDPAIELAALAAMQADGIVGIRLQWFLKKDLPDIAGNEFQQFCARLRELGMHIHLNIEGVKLVEVGTALIETGVKFVIDHFGWHDPVPGLNASSYQGMLRMLECDNVWVKLSSGYRHPDEHAPDWVLPTLYAQDLLQRFGPGKLFWGSDAPFIGHEHVASYGLAVRRFMQCVPDAAQRQAIGENAYRFYFT